MKTRVAKKLVAVAGAFAMGIMAYGGNVYAESTETSTQTEAEELTSDKPYDIGMTVADLTNPIWAEVCNEVEKKGEEAGSKVTVEAANNDPSTQVSQVEDFIQQKKDAIIIQAIDINSVDDVLKKAQDAGIMVMCYGVHTKTYDISLTNDNAGAGKIIGERTGEFIKDNYDGKAQVGLLTFYENQECKIRGEEMKKALAEVAPDAEVVAEDSCVVADKAMTIVENWLQQYPDMKAIMSIGDGGGIGANQAVKAAGKADGFGIFAIDGTIEALQLMANGDPIKEEIAFGAGWQLGDEVITVCINALNDGIDNPEQLTPTEEIDLSNLKDRIAEWGYEDQIDLSKLQ